MGRLQDPLNRFRELMPLSTIFILSIKLPEKWAIFDTTSKLVLIMLRMSCGFFLISRICYDPQVFVQSFDPLDALMKPTNRFTRNIDVRKQGYQQDRSSVDQRPVKSLLAFTSEFLGTAPIAKFVLWEPFYRLIKFDLQL